ncbi:hypothetical protein [Parasulfitobacter algicola]|uniref:RepB-like DNA primase domain-containing protein n=1 Tax=Parasulfitobacter algicola TaxID=2614809 RepID=A0ABX2ITR8_9RHOB|nr:hypothetical protein [Sulfitobacter algicola]NSX56312.1 hypothetical protein [Sulfitobacter algicola]
MTRKNAGKAQRKQRTPIDFMKLMHPEGPWCLTAISLDKKTTTWTFWAGDEEDMKEWIAARDRVENLYFHTNPVMGRLKKKASREHIQAVTHLHVDVDPEPGQSIEEEQDRILALFTTNLPKGIPEPTMLVFSGGGYQAFWKLEEPIGIEGDLGLAEDAKLYNVQIENVFDADNCHNIDRLMRLAGTMNLPDEKKIAKGRVKTQSAVMFHNPKNVYPITQFKKAPPVQNDGLGSGCDHNDVEISDNVEKITDLQFLREEPYNVPDTVIVAINHGGDENSTREGDKSRSGWVHYVCGALGRAGVPDDITFSILTDKGWGISASVLESKDPAKYAKRQIARVRAKNDPMFRIAQEIKFGITQVMKGDIGNIAVDTDVIQNMIDGAFWSGTKSKIFFLNKEENLVQFKDGEAWKFLARRFGQAVNLSELEVMINAGDGPKAEKLKALRYAASNPIIDHIKAENQRDEIEWSVDMFATKPTVKLMEDKVRITLTHKTLPVVGDIAPECLADYKEHFPLIDDVLEFIVASRFAQDRKKSYLWMHCDSDWGKGFLLGILRELGLVVEMSVKEIEAIFEGKPAGRRPEDFKRAFVLAVDEFQTVKAEIKQLQSEMQLAPKNMLTSRVEIFTKLFLSAESVPSLEGENGVEDQFANRMSKITGQGSIDTRPLYQESQQRYFRSIKAYVAETMNRLIEEHRSLGHEGSQDRANSYLKAFIDKHGLGVHFDRLSDRYGDIGEQFRQWIFNEGANCSKVHIVEDGKRTFLKSPAGAFGQFLKDHIDFSEQRTISKRKDDILKAMSVDGKGFHTYRVSDGPSDKIKAVWIAGDDIPF